MKKLPLYALALFLVFACTKSASDRTPGLVKSEFLTDQAPHAQCHASTITETENGLVAAWFGGTKEGNPDVGIWFSRQVPGRWIPPLEVADGRQPDGRKFPAWNPVLFQPKAGPLLLFYKAGPSPKNWWGMMMTSGDGGKTWSKPRRLPDGFSGPIKNKPVQLANGEILCPSSTEDQGWRVHFERTLGASWTKTGPVNNGVEIAAIQPSILVYPGNRLQALGRTQQGRIFEIWSGDGGLTWGKMSLTGLPNNNAGTDAVTLADGRQLLVYNHSGNSEGKKSGPRSPLNVAVSSDGKTWQAALVLENERGEFSYPAVIQSRDGLVHITYTYRREKIKHVILDPAKLVSHDMPDGKWPK
jgi:predicted neuraminidase